MMRGFDSIESMNAEELLVKRKRGSKRCVVAATVIGGLFFLVGILIGYFSHKGESHAHHTPQPERLNPTKFIIEKVDINFLKSRLENFTSDTHLAGTEGGEELAQLIKSLWTVSGIDDVHITSYSVLLSHPNEAAPNKVELVNKTTGKTVFTSLAFEPALRSDENRTNVMNFNAFSASGIVSGDIVYANYARDEDLNYLTKDLKMDLNGKILIARSGEIMSSTKVFNAQQRNAAAMIIYPDPADVNRGYEENSGEKPYPESWWMPDSGVQRENLKLEKGDPNTPGYPSTDFAFPFDDSKKTIPKIPCQPISYGDALQILSNMTGPAPPASWQGGLPVSYRTGPGYENHTDLEVRVTVNNLLDTHLIHNVIGILRGSEEPDRYVLLGAHHDTWAFGAVDPQTASVALTQIVDIFGQLLKRGYRPRRTLIFCSWDAEEQGLIGSTEWIEDNLKIISERVVAYLNVDMLVQGSYTLKAVTSPLLQDALFSAAKQVPSPDSKYKTLYDLWAANPFSDDNSSNTVEPRVSYKIGAENSHTSFCELVGVPSMDLGFTFDMKKYKISTYPLHHSAYDNIYSYENYQDPGFLHSRVMTQLWAVLANNMANATVLPMKVSRYSTAVNNFINDLIHQHKVAWDKNKVNIDALLSAVHNFTNATSEFESHLSSEKVLNTKPYRLRMLNDKMMQLERAFVNPQGLPGRPQSKHVVFSPSSFDSQSGFFFPGISDTMHNIVTGINQWDRLKTQIYIATFYIQSAARTLQEVGL